MKYISAQPDTQYFEWQLELQLRNFRELGIAKHDIHVLISCHAKRGISAHFQKFIERHWEYGNFYIYPDLRIEPRYTSSIRPHILKQHFRALKSLSKETIFYHDSDILFSRIPAITDDNVCYLSDTRNYLCLGYLRHVASEELIDEMLSVIGIGKDVIIDGDEDAGGAQYVLRNIDESFWEKVESDSEDLFILMKDYNNKLWQDQYGEKKEYRSKKRGIQAWCSDMWAVLWNLWKLKRDVKISKELDFSWPYSAIDEWHNKAIQHYSGNIKERNLYFKKSDYINYPPWYDDELDNIPSTNCSFKIVELIKKRKLELDEERQVFPCTLIVICLDSDANKYEAQLFKKYIAKYLSLVVCFKINVSALLTPSVFTPSVFLPLFLKHILWEREIKCSVWSSVGVIQVSAEKYSASRMI